MGYFSGSQNRHICIHRAALVLAIIVSFEMSDGMDIGDSIEKGIKDRAIEAKSRLLYRLRDFVLYKQTTSPSDFSGHVTKNAAAGLQSGLRWHK